MEKKCYEEKTQPYRETYYKLQVSQVSISNNEKDMTIYVLLLFLWNLSEFNVAKSLTLEETINGKSLMSSKNKRGHNTVSCDTLETTLIMLDGFPSTIYKTFVSCFYRKL